LDQLDIYSTGILLLTARSHSALSAQDFLGGRSKRGHPYSKQRLKSQKRTLPRLWQHCYCACNLC